MGKLDEAGLRAAFEAGVAAIDVNLTGVFNTVEIAIPSMLERGQGGAIVLTSSTAGIKGFTGPSRGGLAYTAAKHGMAGLMRSYANNLAPHRRSTWSRRSTFPTRSSGWSPPTLATSRA